MTDDLAALIQRKGVKVLSIRPPTDTPSDADPRHRDFDKWLVSCKTNDFHLDWTRGKPKPTLREAIESALGESLSPKVDLGDILG